VIDFDPNKLSLQYGAPTKQQAVRRKVTKAVPKPIVPLRKPEEEKKADVKPYDYFNKQVDEDEDEDIEIEKRPLFTKAYNKELRDLSDKLDMIDIEDRKLEKRLKRE
jgi:hypothetical protein